MGAQSEWSCSSCGYSAVVSAGKDSGFIATTTTIACSDCRKLYDVQDGWTSGSAQKKNPMVRCPVSVKHTFRIWKGGDPCPGCAGRMRGGDVSVLWD